MLFETLPLFDMLERLLSFENFSPRAVLRRFLRHTSGLSSILFIASQLFCGCQFLPETEESAQTAQAPVVVRSIDEDLLSREVARLLSAPALAAVLVYDDTLRQKYRARAHAPFWVHSESFPSRVIGILRYLLRSDEHGLDPRWYHADELQALVDSVLTGGGSEADHHLLLARIEVLISDGLLRYSTHLRNGVLDPRAVDGAYHLPVRRGGLREFFEPLSTIDIMAYLRNIQPATPRYRELQRAYAGFRDIKRLYRWPRIPALAVEKLEVGARSAAVPALTQRLMLTGELFGSAQAPLRGSVQLVDLALRAYELDSTRLESLGAFPYDSTLANAVMRYQLRHGLLVDGIIGVRTVARMNRGVDAYVDQIRANLERFRWLRYPDRGRYVVVNIPEFWLYAYRDGKVEADMSVCVGQSRAKTGGMVNHETPLITGEFTHCILNPFWHVPWSIATREIYYSAKKDSNYLKRGRYKVYVRDSLVDARSINWAEHSPKSMPFKFRQEPGAGNALGAIKFMFRNDFSIYLHDTPQQWAFRRASRDVSHGCVRIQEPMDFARFLLDGTPDWNVERLQQAIYSGARSKPIMLKERTPVFIDYYTAWVDSSGVLQFRDDVYRKDAVLTRVFRHLPPRG